MSHRNGGNSGKFLPNTPTTFVSHPSLFFSGNDPKEPIGEPPEIYEDPITEEEQETVPPKTMAENRNFRDLGSSVHLALL